MEPLKSVGGWIVVATNLHEEASEEDVHDFFSDYGKVTNVHLNLDRRTGFVKGYAFVEFQQYSEAREAVRDSDRKMNGLPVSVNFAFVEPPIAARRDDSRSRSRSRSPGRTSRR